MHHDLMRQRIKYLVEYGGLYPPGEPASKNFVIKWGAVIVALNVVQLALAVFRTLTH